jgi:hypothetical protein
MGQFEMGNNLGCTESPHEGIFDLDIIEGVLLNKIWNGQYHNIPVDKSTGLGHASSDFRN